MWTLEKVVRLVEEIRSVNPRLKAFAFLNRADPRGVDNQEAANYLADNDTLTFLNAPLGDRKAFSNAATQGLAVTELKPINQKAVEEISTLFQHCYNVNTNTNNNVIKVG
jgi:chromosome partitioning protein